MLIMFCHRVDGDTYILYIKITIYKVKGDGMMRLSNGYSDAE